MLGDDPAVLIPITYDFNVRTTETLGEMFAVVPYAGAGIGIKTDDDKARSFSTIGWFRCSSR